MIYLTSLVSVETTETLESFNSSIFYAIAILLISGIASSIFLEKIKIPHITSYVIGGMIVGPSLLNVVRPIDVEIIALPFSNFGLGLIAFVIGMEFHYSTLKGTGLKIPIIAIIQVLVTIVFVTLGLLVFGLAFNVAIILGAIATATAPGPIIIIIKAFNIRKSKLKNVLLPIVALDDAISVILFALVVSLFAKVDAVNLGSLAVAFREIGISVTFGVCIGLMLGAFAIIKKGYSEFLAYSLSAILFGIAFATSQQGSIIITLMVAGFTFTNLINKEKYLIHDKSISKFAPPMFIMFYTIAGFSLSIKSLFLFWTLILVYVVFRCLGKFIGCYWGAAITKQDKFIKNNLGMAMLGQAGVAIGLSLTLPKNIQVFVLPIVLGAVLIFELISPFLVEKAFKNEQESISIQNQKDSDYGFAIGLSYKQKTKRNIFIRAIKNIKKNNDKKKKDK